MQAKGGWCLTLSVHHTGGEILCTDGNVGAQQRRPALLMPYVLRELLSRILGVLRLFTCGAMPFGYCALRGLRPCGLWSKDKGHATPPTPWIYAI